MSNRDYLAPVIEVYKQKYPKTYVHFLQDVVVPLVGEAAFTEYLESIISKGMAELSGKCNRPIQTVSRHILGFPMHSITDEAKYNYFKRLFYTVWFHKNLDSYANANVRQNIYSLLNMDVEDRRLLEKTKRGFDILQFSDCTLDDTLVYIKSVLNSAFINKKLVFTKLQAYSKIFNCTRKKILSNADHLHQITYFKEIDSFVEVMIRDISDIYIADNVTELYRDSYKYKLFYKYGKSLRSSTIELSKIQSSNIIKQLVVFFRSTFTQENAVNHLHEMQRIILTIIELEQPHKLKCLSMIKVEHLEALLHRWQFEYNFTPGTLSARISSLSNIFHYYISHSQSCTRITVNPCRNIRLFNKEGHTISTENIPPDVLYKLDQHIDELGPKYALLYRLFRRTGCRFSEIALLKVHDFEIQSAEWGQIKITPHKIIKSLKRHGLKEYRYITIPISLVNELNNYVERTKVERQKYQIDDVFYGVCRNRVSTVTSGRFNLLINDLIKKHCIITSDGSLWIFSAKQLRKTFAVDLINRAVPLQVVQHALGHLHQDTTAQYYAKVEMMRISELNHEFFQKMFRVHFQECNIMRYSEDERKLLYVDFCMNKRNVELGYCTKHPAEGTCKSIYTASCSTCPKLCTGVKFLPIWEERIQEKTLYLEELKNLYMRKDIPLSTYSSFPEYSKVFQSLQWDKDVVDKIRLSEEA